MQAVTDDQHRCIQMWEGGGGERLCAIKTQQRVASLLPWKYVNGFVSLVEHFLLHDHLLVYFFSATNKSNLVSCVKYIALFTWDIYFFVFFSRGTFFCPSCPLVVCVFFVACFCLFLWEEKNHPFVLVLFFSFCLFCTIFTIFVFSSRGSAPWRIFYAFPLGYFRLATAKKNLNEMDSAAEVLKVESVDVRLPFILPNFFLISFTFFIILSLSCRILSPQVERKGKRKWRFFGVGFQWDHIFVFHEHLSPWLLCLLARLLLLARSFARLPLLAGLLVLFYWPTCCLPACLFVVSPVLLYRLIVFEWSLPYA